MINYSDSPYCVLGRIFPRRKCTCFYTAKPMNGKAGDNPSIEMVLSFKANKC